VRKYSVGNSRGTAASTLQATEASLQPVSTTRAMLNWATGGIHEEMTLIPGGRFLVTLEAHRSSVDVWDLGEVGKKPLMMPQLVTRIMEKGRVIRYFEVGHTKRTILIAVMFRGDAVYVFSF